MGNVVITLDEHAVAVVLLHGEHPREEAASAVLTRHWRDVMERAAQEVPAALRLPVEGLEDQGVWSEEDGREAVGAHDLRHSLTANAFDMKLTLPEVSRLLRHANPNVTATVYASMAGNAVETLQDRLSGLSVAAGGAS